MGSCIDYRQTQCVRIAPGAIKDLKFLTYGWGTRYQIFLKGAAVKDRVKADIIASFENTLEENAREFTNKLGNAGDALGPFGSDDIDAVKCEYKFYDLGSMYSTYHDAEIVAKEIRDYNPDVVVAVGGGVAYDLVRDAIVYNNPYKRPRIVLIPSIVSTNAMTTNIGMIYNEEHNRQLEGWISKMPPEAIIVDSQLIADSPASMLAAGITDCLNGIEAYYTLKDTGLLEEADEMGMLQMQAKTDIILKHAAAAIEACERHEVTKDLEIVIGAIVNAPGPMKNNELAGVSHVFEDTMINIDIVRKNILHGQRVGFGVLVQYVYDGDEEKIYPLLDLYKKLPGTPKCLKELGIAEYTYDDLLPVVEKGLKQLIAFYCPRELDADRFTKAILRADELACAYLNEN